METEKAERREGAVGASDPTHGIREHGRAITLLRKIIVAVAGTGLALLMLLVTGDVVGRYLFNRPIPGAYELIEYLMAIVVSLSIAYCAEQKAHVGVDLVVECLPNRWRAIVDMVTLSVTVVVMSVLAWQSFTAFGESFSSGLKSAVLGIPAYPFVLSVGVGATAFVLFSTVYLVSHIRGVFNK